MNRFLCAKISLDSDVRSNFACIGKAQNPLPRADLDKWGGGGHVVLTHPKSGVQLKYWGGGGTRFQNEFVKTSTRAKKSA